ncbi:thioesterase domain-containing protein [uncultured Clostridium sp.]|uniref:thioesterase domain-containing protein n=1 Tax=uncultured Clostridium sp. TaxID=59620 RepID=UPI0025EE7EB0|nr:thioesterase domain-containing protein [uncultured Clostridium sp.]
MYFCFSKEVPQLWKNYTKMLLNLNGEDFLKEIVSFGGIQEEVLNAKEIMEMFLSILKSDFKLVESIDFEQSNKTLNCRSIAMNETKDKLLKEYADLWRKFTTKAFKSKYLYGVYFHINK